MKQQKVKLVKQMREEAEQVRVWKQKKEKEVLKLKQNERKQQFQVRLSSHKKIVLIFNDSVIIILLLS